MAGYRFVTVWQVRAPIERVFDTIHDATEWPLWWRGVESITSLRPADSSGLGGVTRYVWKSALPYRLVIDTSATRVDRPYAMDGRSSGELVGEGRWRLSEEDGVTTVRYEWDVATTKAWMNLLGPLLRKAFGWNHDVVMRWGGEGLRARLEGANTQAARLAYLEAAGWRANYDRDWLKLLWLVLDLNRDEFGLRWPRALQAAYYITRASVAWVPVDHNLPVVQRYIERYYRVARRWGKNARFHPERAAEFELRYWLEHRRLSGQPQSAKGPLEDALSDLHAELFQADDVRARRSGVLRARAADAVDDITGRRVADVETAWATVERLLREAYKVVFSQ
ncbi:MAG: SRPBCC family protein [Chloroflexi bacterium]|nr:SRPBCC family protein [Chloroflexota bacterium]